MKGIYKFDLDCGRMGNLYGVFVAEQADVEKLYGERVYFGEVLGKHSEIVAELDEDNFTLASSDPVVVAIVEDLELATGINPLDYYEPEEDVTDDDE